MKKEAIMARTDYIFTPGDVDLPSPDQFKQNIYDKTIRHLFDPVKKFMIARLTGDMAVMVIRLKIISQTYGLPQYSNIADLLVEKSIGSDGLARKEILKLVSSMSGPGKKTPTGQPLRMGKRGKNGETESYEDEQ